MKAPSRSGDDAYDLLGSAKPIPIAVGLPVYAMNEERFLRDREDLALPMTPSDLPAPIRRIAAYFIDCGLVIVYLGLLTAVTRVLEGLGGPNLFDAGSALAFQGTVFMALVLPVWIYLAWCESSAWQATVGKRLLKLQVVTMADQRATFWQTTIRGFVKLVLPWELAHSVLNTNEGLRNMKPGQPLHLTDPTSIQLAMIGIVWVLIIWFAAAIFLGARRPVYDLLAGTKVIRLSTNTT